MTNTCACRRLSSGACVCARRRPALPQRASLRRASSAGDEGGVGDVLCRILSLLGAAVVVALLYRPPPSNPAHTHHPLSHLRSLAHASARPAHPCARPLRRAGHEPEVVAPLADAPLVLVVLLIEPAEENFMCGCGAVRWQGHGLVLGQCDRSACLVAHLRMGGCRQSGQMRCGCMHAAC